jgi:hypothetical protein
LVIINGCGKRKESLFSFLFASENIFYLSRIFDLLKRKNKNHYKKQENR